MDKGKKGGQRPEAYNPLTGNRQFYEDLEDGRVPDQPHTVEPPVYEGPGQVFKRREDAAREPRPTRQTRNRDRRPG